MAMDGKSIISVFLAGLVTGAVLAYFYASRRKESTAETGQDIAFWLTAPVGVLALGAALALSWKTAIFFLAPGIALIAWFTLGTWGPRITSRLLTWLALLSCVILAGIALFLNWQIHHAHMTFQTATRLGSLAIIVLVCAAGAAIAAPARQPGEKEESSEKAVSKDTPTEA